MIIIVDLPAITFNLVFLGFVFILFVLSIKKLKKIVFNALWISAASVLFPIAMNKIFTFPIGIDANSIIFYVTVGLGVYFLYLFARAVYTTLGITEKIAAPIVKKVRTGATSGREKKIDKIIKEKEDEEKLKKIMKKKELKKKEDDYIFLKDTEDMEKKNKNIIRKNADTL